MFIALNALRMFLPNILAFMFALQSQKSFFTKKRRALYHEAESYVSHHQTSKHQCMRLGSAFNLNSQASSPSEG